MKKKQIIYLKEITSDDLEFARDIRNRNRQYFFYDKEIDAFEQWAWFKKIHKDKKLWFYIIFLDKIRIGTISYREGEIGNIIIDSIYRHRGFFKEALLKLLKKHKGEAYLKVLPNNTRAIKAYKALGFKEKEITLWK